MTNKSTKQSKVKRIGTDPCRSPPTRSHFGRMFWTNRGHLRGLGSQHGAGSRVRSLLCSASVCHHVSVLCGGGGRRLSLDGCIPADGSVCWGLAPDIILFLPGERQSPEEGELWTDGRSRTVI